MRGRGSLLGRVLVMGWVLAGLLWPAARLRAQELSPQALASITGHVQMPGAGAQQPDVVIVEYMDYNCPYCRKSAPELHKLLHADPRVQILYKEWPIFGDGSIYAARSALAANWQGKFLLAHDALIGATRDLDQNSDVDAVLRAAGLDLRRLDADRRGHAAQIDAILARNVRETQTLGVRGTPAFLVGRQLITSAMNLAQLQRAVALARTASRPATH